MAADALIGAAAAGGIAIGVTWSIERWGGRVGGLLGTLPSTIVPASVGIFSSNEDVSVFQHAMDSASAGMLVNAIFLYSWKFLPSRLPKWPLLQLLLVMSLLSLGVWLLLAVGLVSASQSLWGVASSAALGWGGLCAVVVIGAGATWRAAPAPRGNRSVSRLALLSRGVFAAAAIGIAIVLSGWLGGLAAGVASIFPAMFLTAMVSLWWSQGQAVPGGAVGPMMLGSASVSAYAVVAREAVPWFGIWTGSLVSWCFAVLLVTVPAWWWLGWRRRVAERNAGP